MAETKSGPPMSLDALFKSKAKKKPKAMNLNAEKPPEPEKPKAVRIAPSPEAGEGWERYLRRDEELLKSCGLRIQEVPGDGACLFRAFADQLNGGNGTEHEAYRERCVDFLQANRSEFEPFLTEDFDEYCARMRTPTAWGGQMEVQALARDLGVNAIIYQPTEAGRPESLLATCVEMVSLNEDSARCVQLSYHPKHHAGQHYNSVRWCVDGTEGPAECCSLAEIKRRIEAALQPEAAPAPESKAGAEEESAEAAPVKKSPFKLNGRA